MGIPGTNSTAIRNADGTWDVLDVPVIHDGSIPRYNSAGEKVDEFKTGEDWFNHVLKVHASAESEGRLGRAFLDHHEDDNSGSQPDAGYIRPRRVGELVVKGKAVPALYIDLVSVPDDVYQEYVKTGRLPGRSIESLVAESGWIDGLALMPTRPAHYALPILTIGREIVSPETAHAPQGELAAVACASGDRALAIFAAKETPMDDDKKYDKEDEGTPVAKGEGGDSGDGGNGNDSKGSGWKAALEALKSVDLTAEEIPEVVAAITEFAASLEAGAAPEAESVEDETPSIEDVPLAEQDEPEEMMARGTADRIIKAEAKAAAAAAKAQSVQDEMNLRDAVDEAANSLAGYHPSLRDRATLRAKAKEHGLKGLRLYVETIKASAPRSPGIGGDLNAPAEHLEDVPDEVLEYTDPAEREVALKTARRLKAMASSGWDMSGIDLKGAIRRDLKSAARAAKAKA